MVLTGDLLEGPELDRIDDELFATDYRLPSQRRHLTVLPEPPTIRFGSRPSGQPMAPGPMVAAEVWTRHPESTEPWPSVTYPASPYSEDENGTEIIALIGLAVLLVVGVAAAMVVVIWWV